MRAGIIFGSITLSINFTRFKRIIMKKLLIFFLLLFSFTGLFAQSYKAGLIAFYNLENLFDTIDNEGVLDEEFTPGGT